MFDQYSHHALSIKIGSISVNRKSLYLQNKILLSIVIFHKEKLVKIP